MDGYGSSKPIPKQDGQEEGQDKYQLEQELAQVLREAEETEREEQAREKEESPDWDGSEAEYVPDDDAEEYEELSPGIGLNYVLRPEEVYECLKHSGFCKTSGKRAMVECVILGICAVMGMAAYFIHWNISGLILAVLCLALIAVVCLVPHLGMKRHARRIANGKELHVEIYPDELQVGRGEGQWETPLDGTSILEEYEELMVISTPHKKMLCIPMRSVEPNVLPDVQAMLLAGTKPAMYGE